MRVWLLALLALLLAPGAASADPACAVPDELRLHDLPLPATAEALAKGGPVRIVTFGAGSTVGRAAGDPLQTYPSRLQAHLAAVWPKAVIEVINAGAAREDTGQMLERLDHDVLARHPSLVIWEVGTNDASRSRDVDDFTSDLEDGIARLQAAHVDVILMDMQYAPSTASIIDFAPYIDALNGAAMVDEVPVFRRYDIMRTWSEQGVFAYDAAGTAGRTALARGVYDCLAAALAADLATVAK